MGIATLTELRPKTEWLPSTDGDAPGHAMVLHVNGVETNIYYWLMSYPSYTSNHTYDRLLAIYVKDMIDAGRIQCKDWAEFDLLNWYHQEIKNVIILGPKDDIQMKNRIYSVNTEGEYPDPFMQADIVNSLIGCKIFTQYCKQVFGVSMSQRIGIKFRRFGYDLGFIPEPLPI